MSLSFLDLSTPPGGGWFPLSSIRLFEKPGDGVDVRRAPALQVCLALALTAAVLAGCTSEADPAPAPAPNETTTPAPATPVPLSLLVFNVEYGGSRATDAVLADLDADVVGVLESYNRLPEIAEAAGYPYYDVGLQILSKYPILEPSGADGLYAFIEVRPGEAVALVNTHLDYVQDGPNRLERGVPVADVLASEEEVRLSSIEKLLPSATRLLDEGWPVLFTGDLNEPSHLDGPIAWPVSEALAGAGLRDAYREAHPDPAADPGHTWGGVAGSGGSPRRIDYAYVGGPVEVEHQRGRRGAGRRQRRPRLPEVDLRPPGRALPADRRSGPDPDHGRAVQPHAHRRGRRDRHLPDAGGPTARSR